MAVRLLPAINQMLVMRVVPVGLLTLVGVAEQAGGI
jgi:hypothetical protein